MTRRRTPTTETSNRDVERPESAASSLAAGPVVTAGAALSHMDLALWLIRQQSPELAALTAKYLIVDSRPSQSAYVLTDHLIHNDPLVERFERWARARLADGFSLDDAAKAVASSKRTLARRTHAVLGKSPLAYVQALRVERAVHLLKTGNEASTRSPRGSAMRMASRYGRCCGAISGMASGKSAGQSEWPLMPGVPHTQEMDRPSAPDHSASAVIDLLRQGCWASLPTETIAALIVEGRVVEFPAGHTVYAEADAERLAVVLDGLLRVYMLDSDGRQVTVRYARTGHLLGVPALVGGPAPVFVQTVTSSGAAFFFDVDRVKRAARRDASVAWALAEESVHRLYDVLEELAGQTFASVRQRVARHLLDLAASRPGTGGRLVAVASQQDLANSVGSVREVVARVLAELRDARVITTSPGRVEILDPVRMSRELWSRSGDKSHSP